MIRIVSIPEAARTWVSRPWMVVFDDGRGVLAACVVAALVAVAFASPREPSIAGVFAPMVIFGLWWIWSALIVRRYNPAIAALGAGDRDGARRTLCALLGPVCSRTLAASALHNLGDLALLAGDFGAAEALFRAADGAAGRGWADGAPVKVLIRARHAIALARLDRTDEAEALLTATEDTVDARAHFALARAFVDLRRGRPDAVIERLDRSRAALDYVLTGEWALLAVGLHTMAVRRLGGVYRGSVRRAAALPCSDGARDAVERLLPGSSDALERSAS